MKSKLQNIVKSVWFLATAGFLLGILVTLGIRFVNYQPEEAVHYHANFAVYVSGQREEFKGPSYYEETSASECNTEEREESPLERAHMHDNINDVVHVEDHLVTWGHFFQNLGWAVDAKHVKTPNQVMIVNDQNKVVFILNGKRIDEVNRLIINSEDKLLISYGNASDQDLNKYYQTIASTAGHYNVTPDSASCGAGAGEPSLRDRLNNLF